MNQLVDKKELVDISKAFLALDLNSDGKLSLDELALGFTNYMPGGFTTSEIDLIMKRVDVDSSKFVDYSEFVVASIDK